MCVGSSVCHTQWANNNGKMMQYVNNVYESGCTIIL